MNIDSNSTLESNEIYNESENENENEKLIDDDIDDEISDKYEKEDNEEIIKQEETKDKKICGFNKFKEEVSKLEEDSFDKTSEYSYETIPEIREEKKSINYL